MSLYEPFDGLVQLIHQRKHLPGQHPQGAHKPHIYGMGVAADVGAGTPVTMKWLSQPPQDEMFDLYYLPERKRLMQAMVDGNIHQEDLEGFQGFTDVPLSGKYRYDHEGTLRNGRNEPCTGAYFKNHAIVHVAKSRMYGDPADLSRTVTHEIGHHVISNMGRIKGGRREVQGDMVIRWAGLGGFTNDQLGNAGLRTYSTTDGGELLADTFVVMRNGTPDQQALLLNIWGEAGYKDNLEEVFKHMSSLTFANELRAVDDGDAVDLILAPTMVTRAVYDKTPWYYVDVI